MALVIGLTGGIGSGKSTVTEQFQQLGIEVVDADIIARQVVEPGQPALAEIQAHFGPTIIGSDGTLDRAQLRSIVFADPGERQWLESLLHPVIRQEILAQLQNSQSDYTLLVAPLLLETGLDQHTDQVIAVDIPRELQLSRALGRDGTSEAQIGAIIDSQISRQERLDRADYVIDNSGDLDQLKQQVAKLDTLLRKLAKLSA